MTTQLINLVVGDWSNDGHGRTNTVLIKANRTASEIEDAHALACSRHNIPKMCEDYEDSSISRELWDQLVDLDVIPLEWYEDADPDAEFDGWLDTDSFVEIYLNLARLVDHALEFEVVQLSRINVGGYGLF